MLFDFYNTKYTFQLIFFYFLKANTAINLTLFSKKSREKTCETE